MSLASPASGIFSKPSLIAIRLLVVVAAGRLLGTTATTNVVEMTPRYSSNRITLTCTVRDPQAKLFKIFLLCPFIQDPYCYSNCHPSCTYDEENTCKANPRINMIKSCNYNLTGEEEVSTTYQINTALINQTGDWICLFKNYKSNPISLAKYEVPITEEPMTTASSAPPRRRETDPVPEDLITQEHQKVETNYKKKSSKEIVNQNLGSQDTSQNMFIQYLTRQEMVLALVVMLGFSLVLNLSFLVRCVLFKSVVDNYHRGVPNSSCVLCCLCIDQYSQQKGYARNVNLYNHVGSDLYRCQPILPDNVAIYDDLSAVSNSSNRNKHRSNHGSDVDDETRLTSFMSNGGCHINSIGVGSVSTTLPRRYNSLNHTAYFHPGIGNYVIVSGPVANQDQYTVGTAQPANGLQIVTPIPSAPESVTGAHLANLSNQSSNSDDMFDSDHSQTTNSLANQSLKLFRYPADMMEATNMVDLPQIVRIPLNGYSQNRQTLVNSLNVLCRPNGSIPLHPLPMENAHPAVFASVSSLPQYSASETGTGGEQVYSPTESHLSTSMSMTAAQTSS